MPKAKTTPYLKLKALRAENQMSADKLAFKIGMAESTYRRKENRYDGGDFYGNEMLEIAKVFNVSPSQIFFAD